MTATGSRCTCADCGEEIEGVVYRFPKPRGGGGWALAARCRGCAVIPGRWQPLAVTPVACAGCGRPVATTHPQLFRAGVVCQPGCIARARDRRRRAARADRSCASCGALFSPGRSDARYCSPACRQRAYLLRRRSTRYAIEA